MEIENEKLLNLQRATFDLLIRNCGSSIGEIEKLIGDNPVKKTFNNFLYAALGIHAGLKIPNPTRQVGFNTDFVDGLKTTLESNMYKYLEITEDTTKEVVLRINVTTKNDRMIDKIWDGMSINLNHNEYSIHLNESEIELPLIHS